MRKSLLVLCLLVSSVGFAQTAFLKEAAAKLDKALTAKDTVVLKQLLHKDLTYGHSNGWVQSKADVVRDIASGKMMYTAIQTRDAKWTVTADVATVRSSTDVQYALDGKAGEMKLHMLQVWLKTNKGWQLVARQSTKLP